MMDLDTLLRCSWCDRRCRDRAELLEHHAQHRREDALRDRLERNSIPEPNSGCLLWLGSSTTAGYPNLQLPDGSYDYAHRVAFRLRHGSIPDGVKIRRKCRVRLCIEGSHLKGGSQSEVICDAVARGLIGGAKHSAIMKVAAVRGQRHVNAKLTDDDVRAIRADTRLQRLIAADHGVKQSLVSRIKARKIWRHL